MIRDILVIIKRIRLGKINGLDVLRISLSFTDIAFKASLSIDINARLSSTESPVFSRHCR